MKQLFAALSFHALPANPSNGYDLEGVNNYVRFKRCTLCDIDNFKFIDRGILRAA